MTDNKPKKSRPGGGNAARERIIAAGGKQVNVVLTADQLAAADRVAKSLNITRLEAIRAAVIMADDEISKKS